MGDVVKRAKSPQEALQSLMRLCARAERSTGDAMRLMARWGVVESDARAVVARLVADRFIDDRRYVECFVREKVNLGGWGAYKIKTSLRRKGISQDIVAEVVEPMLGEVDMASRLTNLMQRKIKSIKAKNAYDLKAKLVRFGASRGFDMALSIECASTLVGEIDEEFFD